MNDGIREPSSASTRPTDFCARFLDENDRPITTLTTTLTGA
jgi:hypothetical protein